VRSLHPAGRSWRRRRAALSALGDAGDAVRAVGARRRRRRVAADRRTLGVGLLALLSAGGVAADELARVWRQARPRPGAPPGDVLEAAEEAARQTVEIARAGYRGGSRSEAALLAVLASFTLTFGAVRATTHAIRRRGRLGPMRNLKVGRRRIHHFVPGIVLAFIAGGVGIVSQREDLDSWLALPFGVGLALTLDESALLLEFDDVYWTEEGVISVQITLGALGVLSALVLARRALRRGEHRVVAGSRPPLSVVSGVGPDADVSAHRPSPAVRGEPPGRAHGPHAG
jgi:hypothetical protein